MPLPLGRVAGVGALIEVLGGPAAAEALNLAPPFDLNDAKAIEAGRLVFSSTCVYCHGDEGLGGRALPLRDRDDFTPDYVFTTISNGLRVGSLNMPTWKNTFDETTRWQLTAYVLSLRSVK